ncbi:hypothetical protein HY256_00300, partial [Candidatus Sumerlaeota bacterium]|nr:hypothetical protein [Candidatus Sumerlaeota bacterium]
LACAAKGLRDEAVREAETALRLQPDYTEAKILLAQLQKGAAPQPPPK